MLAVSTPNRQSRGVAVPLIDTRAPVAKSTSAVQCAGWLTPPQSAHESRRPSLAYSSYPEMPYSAASTSTAFSLPTTPVRSTPSHRQHAIQHFPEDQLSLDFPVTLGNHNLSQDMVHLSLENHNGCDLIQDATWPDQATLPNGLPDYSNHVGMEQPEGIWHDHQTSNADFMPQSTGLQTTLFPISHGMVSCQSVIPHTYDSKPCSMTESVASLSAYQHDALPTAYNHCSGIVEPSLVNPHDGYPDSSYTMLQSPSSSPQEMSTSLASSLDSFEEIRTPSPELDYRTDLDGFVLVEPKVEMSPTLKPSLRARGRSGNRKMSKRQRKTQCIQQRKNHNNTGIDLQLAGDAVGFDENGQFYRTDHTVKKKAYVCDHIDMKKGVRCTSAFARSEHLKRHLSKHSDVRLYPCVLPDCKKDIGRSDNACDHYRTHLGLARPNKRNKHFHWREAERRILLGYPEARARKILANLQRWLEAECARDLKLREAHEDEKWVEDRRPIFKTAR